MTSNLNNGVILGYMRDAHADSVAVAGGSVFNRPSRGVVIQCGGGPGLAQQPRSKSGAQANVGDIAARFRELAGTRWRFDPGT